LILEHAPSVSGGEADTIGNIKKERKFQEQGEEGGRGSKKKEGGLSLVHPNLGTKGASKGMRGYYEIGLPGPSNSASFEN